MISSDSNSVEKLNPTNLEVIPNAIDVQHKVSSIKKDEIQFKLHDVEVKKKDATRSQNNLSKSKIQFKKLKSKKMHEINENSQMKHFDNNDLVLNKTVLQSDLHHQLTLNIENEKVQVMTNLNIESNGRDLENIVDLSDSLPSKPKHLGNTLHAVNSQMPYTAVIVSGNSPSELVNQYKAIDFDANKDRLSSEIQIQQTCGPLDSCVRNGDIKKQNSIHALLSPKNKGKKKVSFVLTPNDKYIESTVSHKNKLNGDGLMNSILAADIKNLYKFLKKTTRKNQTLTQPGINTLDSKYNNQRAKNTDKSPSQNINNKTLILHSQGTINAASNSSDVFSNINSKVNLGSEVDINGMKSNLVNQKYSGLENYSRYPCSENITISGGHIFNKDIPVSSRGKNTKKDQQSERSSRSFSLIASENNKNHNLNFKHQENRIKNKPDDSLDIGKVDSCLEVLNGKIDVLVDVDQKNISAKEDHNKKPVEYIENSEEKTNVPQTLSDTSRQRRSEGTDINKSNAAQHHFKPSIVSDPNICSAGKKLKSDHQTTQYIDKIGTKTNSNQNSPVPDKPRLHVSTRTIKVTNLPQSINRESLKDLLKKYGKLETIDLRPNKNLAFCIFNVIYGNKIFRDKILADEKHILEISEISTDKNTSSSLKKSTICVHNIDKKLNVKNLKRIFKKHKRSILNIQIQTTHNFNLGYCIILFKSREGWNEFHKKFGRLVHQLGGSASLQSNCKTHRFIS